MSGEVERLVEGGKGNKGEWHWKGGENAKRGRWRASVRGKGECEVDREEVERKVGCGEGRQRGKVREGDRT